MNFSIYQASRIGGRKYNQDRVAYAYSNEALLLVLADGMGGHLHGEIAAQITVQTFTAAFEQAARPRVERPEKFLSEVMKLAHLSIIDYAREQQLGGNPGTTCVAALVQDGKACWAHAGDSRCYLMRGNEIALKTHDHSVVQMWADWGIIRVEDMRTHPDRNKITNCLGGVEGMFYAESAETVPLEQGDVLLLCSDGLWGPVHGEEMAPLFCTSSLSGALESMMDEALSRDGKTADNTTAVVARIGDAEGAMPASAPVSVVLDLSEGATSEVLGRTIAGVKGFNPG